MTQALTFVCDLSITIYNAMENKNEINQEAKAKGIQFLFILAMLIDKTEYMLSAGPISNDEV